MSSFRAMSEVGSPTVQVLQSFEDGRPKLSTLAWVCADIMEDDLVQFWRGNGLAS